MSPRPPRAKRPGPRRRHPETIGPEVLTFRHARTPAAAPGADTLRVSASERIR